MDIKNFKEKLELGIKIAQAIEANDGFPVIFADQHNVFIFSFNEEDFHYVNLSSNSSSGFFSKDTPFETSSCEYVCGIDSLAKVLNSKRKENPVQTLRPVTAPERPF
jgi:hypothetical protein